MPRNKACMHGCANACECAICTGVGKPQDYGYPANFKPKKFVQPRFVEIGSARRLARLPLMPVSEALRIADGCVVRNPHANAMLVLAAEVRRLRKVLLNTRDTITQARTNNGKKR